jgi:putative ABC transport system permease protein
LNVQRPAQRGALYERILSSFQTMLVGLSLLCLVAGTYITYNTTSTGAVHRALGIAGLRVTGADRRQLFGVLMLEALLLGAVGTAIGIPAGVLLARLLGSLVTESMGVIFQLRFGFGDLVLNPGMQALIAALGIGATAFGSYFAARRVTTLDPLDVLRADLRTLAVRTSAARLLGWWLALVATTVLALVLEMRLKSVAWGNFGSTLWFASSIVIAVPVVTVAAPLLGRLLGRLFGPAGAMAADSLVRAPTRTGVTVAAIALVLTVGVTFASMARSHRESVRGYVTGGVFSSDLTISAVATEGGWLESPVSMAVAEEIRGIPGVAVVETLRILPGQLYQGQRITVAGISPGLFEPSRYPPGWYRKGDPEDAAVTLQTGRGIVISTNFADRFAADVGTTVTLDTPTGPLALPVVGIAPEYMSDRGSILLDAGLLASRWQDGLVNWALAFVADGAEPAAVRAAIARRLGDRYRLKILTLNEVVDYLSEKIDRAYDFTVAIQLLIVIVTVAGIFDLLIAAIVERRRELAVWRVIGADAAAVRRAVTLESGAVGLLGSALGIAVGIVTARIWVEIHYKYLLGYHLEPHFAGGSAAWYTLLVMLMTVAAGYGAARYATRQSILGGIQTH